MAPVRSSTRRGAHPTPTPPIQDADGDDPNTNKELFLDPMLGTPLAIYLEKEVEDKDNIAQLIIVSLVLQACGMKSAKASRVAPACNFSESAASSCSTETFSAITNVGNVAVCAIVCFTVSAWISLGA